MRRVADYVLDAEKQARTVDVEVEFLDPDDIRDLLAGYSADVEIILDVRKDTLRVPSEALVEGNRVFVFDAGQHRLEQREVKTGVANWDHTEILGGLSQGDLHIDDGDYVSVMGPSGSGKSTLLNVLGLLDRPTRGEYRIDGQPTTDLGEEQRAALRRDHIGFVFQAFHLVPRLSAAENIALPMVLAGIAPAERERRVDEGPASLDLSNRAHHRPGQLSGGQRQRVAIGRAIVMRPGLLLADEPTGNLDQHSGQEVIALLEQLNGEGITLVVVTHDAAIGRRARRRIHMLDEHIHRDEPDHAPA